MNNSKTPKIIVGVGLAVVYAAGISFYMLRGSQDSVAAPAPMTAPAAQMEAAPGALAESAVATPSASSLADAAAQAIAEDVVQAESPGVAKSTVTVVQKPQSARAMHRNADSPSAAVASVSSTPSSGAAGSGASIEAEVESSPAQEGGVSIVTEGANIPAESSSDIEGAGEGNLEAN